MSQGEKYIVVLLGGNVVVHRHDTYEGAKAYIVNNNMKNAWIAYLLAWTPPISLTEDKEAIEKLQ